MVESSTMGDEDSGTPPTYSAGPASAFSLQRSGHAFNMQENFLDISTGFETELGFIESSNFRNNQTHATYQWFPKHRFYQSFGLETNQNVAFNHQGDRVFHYSSFDPFWLLPRNIVIAPLVGQNSDTVSPAQLHGAHQLQELYRELSSGSCCAVRPGRNSISICRPSAAAT